MSLLMVTYSPQFQACYILFIYSLHVPFTFILTSSTVLSLLLLRLHMPPFYSSIYFNRSSYVYCHSQACYIVYLLKIDTGYFNIYRYNFYGLSQFSMTCAMIHTPGYGHHYQYYQQHPITNSCEIR